MNASNKQQQTSLTRRLARSSNIYENDTKAASWYVKSREKKWGVPPSRGSRYRRDDQNDRKVASEPAWLEVISESAGQNGKQSESH